MQQFIIIPEIEGIIRKVAPNGNNYAGFGVRDVGLLEAYLRQMLRLGEHRYFWTTHPNVLHVEETCNNSS